MCGIIAYLSQENTDVYSIIHKGLIMLQNRGYDSAGICTIRAGKLENSKYASDSSQTALQKLNGISREVTNIGIGHTRWATHGAKTDANAHPHVDNSGRFALVHNGIIENYESLKSFLLEQNIQFHSETDSEVIVNLIAYYYNITSNVSEAIKHALARLSGTWALVILCTETPSTLYLCKHGSPLVVGFNDREIMVASEVSCFRSHISEYIILEGMVAINNVGCIKHYPVHSINILESDTSPAPYDHWMLKEIHEQPQSIMRALNNGGRIKSPLKVHLGGLERIKNRIIRNLVLIASGTSLYAGLYGAFWLKKLAHFNSVTVVDASEFCLEDLPLEAPGVIVLSQSGETKDLHRTLELIHSNNDTLPLIGIVNVVDSLIARTVDCGVYLNAGREHAVASTKSFTNQCIILLLMVAWFFQESKSTESFKEDLCSEIIYSLSELSPIASKIISQHESQCIKIAELLAPYSSCYILGRQSLYPIALEYALKLKEVGGIHAEGYCGGALKHGPFALINDKTYVLILDDGHPRTSATIEEIASRQGKVILISNNKKSSKYINYKIQLEIEHSTINFIYIIIGQLIAYHLALIKGMNPDYPINLAKVVTVDG
jgi:glucosamine--fructose-6-phosphate aminotransferase (isomerizing)